MGLKQSTANGGGGGASTSDESTTGPSSYSREYRGGAGDAAESVREDRARARSLAAIFAGTSDRTVVHNRPNAIDSIFSPFGVRTSTGAHPSQHHHPNHHDESSMAEMEAAQFAHSLPGYLLFSQSFKCPFCSKTIMPDDAEVHLVMCITKPQLNYNDDILTEDKGECVICLEEMLTGNQIARLPCLCIYHKTCIDNWFQVNRSCPEHPSDD